MYDHTRCKEILLHDMDGKLQRFDEDLLEILTLLNENLTANGLPGTADYDPCWENDCMRTASQSLSNITTRMRQQIYEWLDLLRRAAQYRVSRSRSPTAE